MTTIRRIRVAEAAVVRELYARMVAEQAARHPEDEIGISEAGLDNLETSFRLGAVHGDVLVLVAERDGELVGFLAAEITRSPALPCTAGEIAEVWAAGEDGDALRLELVRAAVDALRERGVGPVFHPEDAEHTDRAFWRALGFEPDVIRFSLYPEAGGGS